MREKVIRNLVPAVVSTLGLPSIWLVRVFTSLRLSVEVTSTLERFGQPDTVIRYGQGVRPFRVVQADGEDALPPNAHLRALQTSY